MIDTREIRIRRGVRGTALVLGVLALASIVIGVLPGHEVYSRGLVVERTTAGGSSFVQYMAWLAAPGVVAWFHPRLGVTVLWTVLGWIGTLAYLVVMFGAWHTHGDLQVQLWPAQVLPYLATALIGAILIVMPVAALVVSTATIVADRRASARARFEPPVARIHREKRPTTRATTPAA
jgi:hypothetical protein